MTEVQKNLVHLLIQQMSILNSHASRVIQAQDLDLAIKTNNFLQNLTMNWNLIHRPTQLDLAKKVVLDYPEYIFSFSALRFLENFLRLSQEIYPTKKSLLNEMPLYQSEIDQIYQNQVKSSSIPFEPKSVDINLESNLYHTTNAFEIFEQKLNGTPLGPASFNIDSVYPEYLISELYPDRGAMRVISYRWLTNPWKENISKSYPLLDSDAMAKPIEPKILDGRDLKVIPKDVLEDYMEKRGVALYLPEPNLAFDILNQYGRNWRPFLIDYLKSLGFDGVLIKNDEIVLFQPKRWISFYNIQAADPMYLAFQDVLHEIREYPQVYNKDMIQRFLIPKMASKHQVDPISLQIIYNLNFKNQ